MSRIVKPDPFPELVDLNPFREFAAWPYLRHWLAETPARPAIRLDVSEDGKAYRIKADLPGAKREDIEVEIDGNQVSVTALATSRSFTLARPVNRERVEARFRDGVLELTLPKDADSPAKRISVQ